MCQSIARRKTTGRVCRKLTLEQKLHLDSPCRQDRDLEPDTGRDLEDPRESVIGQSFRSGKERRTHDVGLREAKSALIQSAASQGISDRAQSIRRLTK